MSGIRIERQPGGPTRLSKRRGVLAGLAALAIAGVMPLAPSAALGQQPAGVPQGRLAVEPLAIRTKGGTVHFLVEMARSPAEQSKGLMFRTEVPDGTGMLFAALYIEVESRVDPGVSMPARTVRSARRARTSSSL